MNIYGYQPKMRCNSCLAFNVCKKSRDGKEACKKYKGVQPAPPKTGSNAPTPTYTPPPMPEVKPAKQRTVLSVRDFAILMNLANMYIDKLENEARCCYHNVSRAKTLEIINEQMEELRQQTFYQDLLRIREKLGELNIEIETPRVEVD